jgi:hypothetical protein
MATFSGSHSIAPLRWSLIEGVNARWGSLDVSCHNGRVELLTQARIALALERLNTELAAKGVRAELYVIGGAVMCLALDARPAPKDIDAWFTEPQAVRDAALRVARELSLPDDWLNDAAKGFIPAGAHFERWRSFSHLDVSLADAKALLAMKCAAVRTSEDAADIRLLCAQLVLSRVTDILKVVETYFPAGATACPVAPLARGDVRCRPLLSA